jgi:hypothetical protein
MTRDSARRCFIQRSGAALIAVSTLTALAAFTFSSPAFGGTNASIGALSKIVMPTPKGFISDGTSLSGGPTGRIGFYEATSADCNINSSLILNWAASQLRFFVSSLRNPQKYLLVCVSLLRSSAVAKENVLAVADNPYMPSKMPFFAPIPGAHVHQTGPATQVVFSVGRYFIFVAGIDLPATGAVAVHFVESFAIAQYHRAAT